MRSLTLRIYVTVVAVLLLFAFGSGWLFQRQVEHERSRAEVSFGERMGAWAELIQRALPPPTAPRDEQAAALREWSQRLRLPLALDTASGQRLAVSELFEQRQSEGIGRAVPVRLADGRTLWVMRPGMRPGGQGGAGGGEGARAGGFGGASGGPGAGPGGAPGAGPGGERMGLGPGGERMGPGPEGRRPGGGRLPAPVWWELPWLLPGWPRGTGLVALFVVLFLAVAAGAWPAARGLTRRLRRLQQGVESFGAGELHRRVDVGGRDDVAALASSFNQAADRIEALVRSHQSLLANASHELRSPLARMKMAISLLDEQASPAQRERLRREVAANIAELDSLVEEVLLASRLDVVRQVQKHEPVDLLGLAAEEAARSGAALEDGSAAVQVQGDERLLRRALRNLLENAAKYGGDEVTIAVGTEGAQAWVRVCDRGPGVPEGQRERIFEPFYRMPGHAEAAGGVGLGLSLVRQIAVHHGGQVQCLPRQGGGSCFEVRLPREAGPTSSPRP